MLRLLFEKTGQAIWMSHLDLMRLFQRAFKRAGLPLTHTQGFNPRPSVSIALPLSVGVESKCELLDFDLDRLDTSCAEIRDKLNASLVDGVRVLQVYKNGGKLKNLSLLDCTVTLEYDQGIPHQAQQEMAALFSRSQLLVEKRTKNGITEQDLIPMIRRVSVCRGDANMLMLRALVCCQNPTLNPMQLIAAIERYLPDMKPDFAKCCRNEIYDTEENIFR